MQSFDLERPGQPRLRYALFEPAGNAVGSVFVTPGFGEHIGRYEHVARAWAEQGFLVAVHDPRGQGDSAGRRAFVERFEEYVLDVLALLDALGERAQWVNAGKPILFGHSMGGLISSHVALVAQPRLLGLALASPFFGQALATPAWKKQLGRLFSHFWPTYSDKTNITGAMVTHDPERIRWIEADPKYLDRVTARWFTEVEAAQARLLVEAPRLQLPVFCLASGADLIASVAATRQVFERITSDDKQLVVAEGEYHELHQELRRDEHLATFAARFRRWVNTTPTSQNDRDRS